MSVEQHNRICKTLEGAYKTAKKKAQVVEFLRRQVGDTVLKAFDKNDWQKRAGYVMALEEVNWNEEYWTAHLHYGPASLLTIVFKDPEPLEEALVHEFPQAAVYVVMES